MLKVEVKNLTDGTEMSFYGSEVECLKFLRNEFPQEVGKQHDLKDAAQAINEFGSAEVTFDVWTPSIESNTLPEDYLTHQDDGEDWGPREDDLKE